MNITVYIGSCRGNNPKYEKAAKELGYQIAQAGDVLVYGGSDSGLMGTLADAVLQKNGKVIGVELQMFMDEGLTKQDLTQLIVTKDMHERKKRMMDLGDVFIAFPGGTGTLEEITEVMSAVSLDLLSAPCILYNLDGYYDKLKDLLETMRTEGFSNSERQKKIYFANNLAEIKDIVTCFEQCK